MNKIIMCEGATDAILLSYYLEKAAGWSFCMQPPKNIAIKEAGIEESVNWYKKGDDRLLICAVGGKDKIKPFFEDRIKSAIINAGAFEKIALVLDRDNKEIKDIEEHASHIFSPVVQEARNNEWIQNQYMDAYKMQCVMQMLLVVIPTEYQGALETVMLDAIAEDPYDAKIVSNVSDFVKSMRKIAGKYISSDRKELKAKLGVTWAVQYPEKVFKLINEQIESVKWEKSEVLNLCFKKLIEI